MKRVLALAGFVALGAIGLAAGLVASDVAAETGPAPKVFVCKFVGTPGPNERLQTGDNPINVNGNSIKEWNGENPGNLIGLQFPDAQGFSRVIAIDTGQPEPTCQGLPPLTEVTPVAPTFQDPTCDVAAAVNLPTVTGVTYSVKGTVAAGHEVTVEATADEGYVLVGTHEWEHIFGPAPSTCGAPPPHEVTGDASVSCILPDGFYRVSGTVDGHAADNVDPATIPGSTKGGTEVTVTRGDTSVKTTVSTNGDCGNASTPPVVTTTPVVTTSPLVQTTPTVPTAPLTPPKASPKPAAPPKVEPATTKPAKPTVKVEGAVAKEPPKLAYTP